MKGSCSPPYPLTPPPLSSPRPPPRPTHLESPEGRGCGAWSRGTTFQPPSPSSIDSSLNRRSGKWAQGLSSSCQLLKGWPHNVSCEILKLCSQNVPELVPGILVMASPSLSPTDLFVPLHSDLGLPEVKEGRAKEKLPRLWGSKFKVICLERWGSIFSICAK